MSSATDDAAGFLGMTPDAYRDHVDPVIYSLLDEWKASVAVQPKVLRLAVRAVGTYQGSEAAERRRGAVWWRLLHVYAPMWLRAAGHAREARMLRDLEHPMDDLLEAGRHLRMASQVLPSADRLVRVSDEVSRCLAASWSESGLTAALDSIGWDWTVAWDDAYTEFQRVVNLSERSLIGDATTTCRAILQPTVKRLVPMTLRLIQDLIAGPVGRRQRTFLDEVT